MEESCEQQVRDMLVRMGYPSARYASNGTVVELANLINDMSRFKVDVAYMPVPRCDGCRHWDHDDITSENTAECTLGIMSAVIDHTYLMGDTAETIRINFQMRTKAGFGCTEWEAK